MRAIAFLWLLVGCEPKVTEESCADDEVFVEDACVECGDAGGCDRHGDACRPACADTGFDCIDGVRLLVCD